MHAEECGHRGGVSIRTAPLYIDAVLRDATTPEGIRAHTTELRARMGSRAGNARLELTGEPAGVVAVDDVLEAPPPTSTRSG